MVIYVITTLHTSSVVQLKVSYTLDVSTKLYNNYDLLWQFILTLIFWNILCINAINYMYKMFHWFLKNYWTIIYKLGTPLTFIIYEGIDTSMVETFNNYLCDQCSSSRWIGYLLIYVWNNILETIHMCWTLWNPYTWFMCEGHMQGRP